MTLEDDMKKMAKQIRSNPVLRKYNQQEGLILDVTELMAKLMEEKHISYMKLAKMLGVTRERIIHILEGSGIVTLRQAADIFTALGSELVVGCKELK